MKQVPPKMSKQMDQDLDDVVDFLDQHSFLFDLSNVTFVRNNVIRRIPNGWTDYLRSKDLKTIKRILGNCGADDAAQDVPESLANFINKRHEFVRRLHDRLDIQEPTLQDHHCIIDRSRAKGMSPKKIHEVQKTGDPFQFEIRRKF